MKTKDTSAQNHSSAQNNTTSPEKISRAKIWWQLSFLILVSAVAVYVGSAFDEQIQNYMPEQRVLSSIFNKKPSGLSGLSEVMKKVGLTVHPWLLPYRNLRNAHGMLVIVAPSTSPAEFEAEQILKWVQAGNDLVYLDHFSFKMTRRLLEKINLTITDGTELHDRSVPVDASKKLFAYVPKLTVTSDTNINGGEPLVKVDDKAIFSELQYGKGRILIGTSPTLCSNRRLSEKNDWSNFQFLVNWMSTASGDIMFDERCHGFSESGNVFVVLGRSPWGAVFLQLVLMLAVAVYSCSKRFGATATLNDARKISNLEFITGLSNAYRRAKANGAIYEITGHTLRNRLCKLLSVSPHEQTSKVIEAWNAYAEASPNKAGAAAALVPQFLTDFDAAIEQQRNIPDQQFKSLIINCDKIADHLNNQSNTTSLKRLGS
ncbi:MAG: DUF4350 domain-containing protein [Candidatus Melainabacteria bacterium]|nr:MAG: DUF4350 domain-containing protein [Candidatus Melainabacteria bacterium]